jgi:peptide/nickel transport system substrate-binding protein
MRLSRLTRRLLATAPLVPALALALGGTAAEAQTASPRVLRVAPHADLKTLDPVFASIVITRMHGMAIYETLFAWDSNLQPKPQMVESYTTAPDGLSWSFTLRPGLRFHDGQPVTSRDVVASLHRWMARDVVGGKLKEYMSALEVTDDRSFTLRLQRPMALVPFALGSAIGQIPAIMRESDARTDPAKAVTQTIGSGPFRFNRTDWQSGARVVYDRNAGLPAPRRAGGWTGRRPRGEAGPRGMDHHAGPGDRRCRAADRRDRHLGTAGAGPDSRRRPQPGYPGGAADQPVQPGGAAAQPPAAALQ